jgi:acyl carrier protein
MAIPGRGRAVHIETIREWLLSQVAFYLQRPVSELAGDVKLVEYGLDSVYALTLCGDIEDEYDLEIEPALVWDHPTSDSIAERVRELLAERGR